jgi:hypothetical protein
MRRWVSSGLLLGLVLSGSPALAQSSGRVTSLGPTAPSQLVTLSGVGLGGASACGPSQPNSAVLTTRVLPDGGTAPFAVGPGEVLVLTGVDAIFVNHTGTPVAIFSLIVGDPAVALSSWNAAVDVLDPAGLKLAYASAPLSGIVVKAGASICLSSTFATTGISGKVHGFLAPDR